MLFGVSDQKDWKYLSTRNGTNDRGLLVLVAQTLSSNVRGTTIGELDDDGRLDITSSFKSSIDGAKALGC